MSWNVTARAAESLLQRKSQAMRTAMIVLKPNKGVKPQMRPMATPPAMAWGVSRICVRRCLARLSWKAMAWLMRLMCGK